MFKDHPTFIAPEDTNVKIWRYIDFTKFVSLLDSNCLWFCRADKFQDPLEGSYPKMNVETRGKITGVPPKYLPYVEKILKGMSETKRDWPRYTAINCWHINEHESSAMWSLYLKSNEGIAIQSTYNMLKDSFTKTKEDVYIGKVNYIDYEHQVIEDANLYSPFIYKRKSYEHERELRAIVMKPPPLGRKGLDFTVDTIDFGINIPVIIDALIESVYIAPSAPDWFGQLVESALKKYGYTFPINQSTIYSAEPLF